MTASGPGLTPSKLALRRTVRAQRASRTTEERMTVARALAVVALEMPAIRRSTCVAAYASRADEPGTEALRAALRARGTRVLLPVVVDDKHLDWAHDDGRLLISPGLGLPEPAGDRLGPEALGRAGVVIVPALAVDTEGNRLGQGRGYYDRALRQVADRALVLALLHDEEVLDATTTPVPRDAHDVPVRGVITPTRWMMFTSR